MLERPVPQTNEVLIRVKAAGLDYGQWHLMAGKPYAVRRMEYYQPNRHTNSSGMSSVSITSRAAPGWDCTITRC
jgi:hypothetical protein